jgi:hypothetical protein
MYPKATCGLQGCTRRATLIAFDGGSPIPTCAICAPGFATDLFVVKRVAIGGSQHPEPVGHEAVLEGATLTGTVYFMADGTLCVLVDQAQALPLRALATAAKKGVARDGHG